MKKLIISIILCNTIAPIMCMQPNIITQLRERELGLRRRVDTPSSGTFNIIQQIRAVVKDIAQEAIRTGVFEEIDTSEYSFSRPFFHRGQTKRGFYLLYDSDGHCSLMSPVGFVRLTDAPRPFVHASQRYLFNELRKRLKLKFVQNESEDNAGPKTTFHVGNATITQNDLNKFRGTSANIWSNHRWDSSIYEILTIDGIPLPKPELFQPDDQLRDENILWSEWDILGPERAHE